MKNTTTEYNNYPQMGFVGQTTHNAGAGVDNHMPPPPSYDQATGSAIPTASGGYPGGHTMQQPPNQQQPTMHSHPIFPNVSVQQHPAVVIIHQPAALALGPEPVYLTCPSCHIQKLTRIEYEPSSRTHLMAAILCLIGLWCCVCLPYCAGSCMNTNHYCGNCNKFLGTYGAL